MKPTEYSEQDLALLATLRMAHAGGLDEESVRLVLPLLVTRGWATLTAPAEPDGVPGWSVTTAGHRELALFARSRPPWMP